MKVRDGVSARHGVSVRHGVSMWHGVIRPVPAQVRGVGLPPGRYGR